MGVVVWFDVWILAPITFVGALVGLIWFISSYEDLDQRVKIAEPKAEAMDAVLEITRVQYETERALWAAATEASPVRDGQ